MVSGDKGVKLFRVVDFKLNKEIIGKFWIEWYYLNFIFREIFLLLKGE